ncbi:MAG: 23S rRNA (uracil(1939)-C(5))-methyltransferase RlmD [Deltaproteobacteria bacterium]|nr:23S rRNA (uracil(1939)-C(5))-methyltransferase RlmD [Deltaproteobacteria bacterium]
MAPSCAYFDRGECRSCSLLALPARERSASKLSRFTRDARAALGDVPISALWEPPRAFGSRTKAKLAVSGSMRNAVIGLPDGASGESASLLDCPLHAPRLNEVLRFVKGAITEFKLAPYHVERRQGELKGIILKCNEDASQVLARFVLRSPEALPRVRRAARALVERLPFVRVVSANIQPLPAALLEGGDEIVLTEERFLWERYGDVLLAFQPQSFSQVTHATAEALYRHVAGVLSGSGARSLLDLFCGVGGFSLTAAGGMEWGLGVELSENAIECARLGAAENGATQLAFESGDVEAFLARYSGKKPDAVVVNPPRRGLSPAIVEGIKALRPGLIAYSSCNPETLLRDLRLFAPAYRVASLAPFDMFPLTEHLEAVATLARTV